MEILERQVSEESALDESLHPVLKRVYSARGVFNDNDLSLDLAGLHPPALLKNIDQASTLLADAIIAKKNILVVGDFDADGATSSALFVLCLQAMGHQRVDFLVPNRFEFGYGLTPEIVTVAAESNPDLIVTVDNGIASHEGVKQAIDAGISVLVTDHHLPGHSLPEASCILNPNLADCTFPSKALAGVGVVFYLMSALRVALRNKNWFELTQTTEPNLANYLDLVALGTVADVVPLDQNNRRLIKHGLGIIRNGKGRPGIRALLEVAGKNPRSVVASDLGFAAGPRLNAAGRLDDMSLGIACLIERNPSSARQIAQKLDGLNRDRKQIEADMQAQAMEALNTLELSETDQCGICLYDPGWHQGVIGILASRIKEKFHRPCIIFADTSEEEEGATMIKGSARSIEGLHIRDALDSVATSHPKILKRFGGHAMAAGLAIKKKDFAEFVTVFNTVLSRELTEETLQQRKMIDGKLNTDCFSLTFASTLREAGPWGQHFPEPEFLGDFLVINSRVVGEKHLKLTLQIPDSEDLIDAIAFNVEPALLESALDTVTLVYRLDVNEFRGNCNPQLLVDQIVDYSLT